MGKRRSRLDLPSIAVARRNGSQRAGPPGTMSGESLVGQRVELAGRRIGLELGVPVRSVVVGKPRAEARQFLLAKSLNLAFDLLKPGHGRGLVWDDDGW